MSDKPGSLEETRAKNTNRKNIWGGGDWEGQVLREAGVLRVPIGCLAIGAGTVKRYLLVKHFMS